MCGTIPPLRNTPSWRDAQLKHRDSFTFTSVVFHVMWHIYIDEKNSWLAIRSRSLPEKLKAIQLVKNFLAFYGTKRFTTVFTTACRWSLSWVTGIQSKPSHPDSLRSVLILYSYIRPGRFVLISVILPY